MPTVEERFSRTLQRTGRIWRHALDQRLKDLGVGQAGWMAIAYVAKSAAPPSQKQLAKLLSVEGPTIVATLDRLAAAALIERIPSSTDRRVKLVALTDAGRAVYAKVNKEATAFRKQVLAGLDPAVLLLATELMEALEERIGERDD